MSKRNELRDDIYQRMHGFKTVKRGYRKDGQSKWYCGAHSVEDMKEIDVPSENAPNPKLNDILADDMQKNPQDYYIWRTKKDDKVSARIKTTVAPVVFTASGEVLLMSKGGVNRL